MRMIIGSKISEMWHLLGELLLLLLLLVVVVFYYY